MKSNTLAEILRTHGQGTNEDNAIVIPEGQSITLYASLGGEALMVGDVRSVEITDETVLARTGKKDLFAIAVEDVRAVRVGAEAAKKKTGLIRS